MIGERPRYERFHYEPPNYALEHTIGAVLTKIAKGEEETLACIDITTGSDVILWGAGSSVPNIVRYTGD